MDNEMVRVNKSGQMVPDMKVNGDVVKQMVMVH